MSGKNLQDNTPDRMTATWTGGLRFVYQSAMLGPGVEISHEYLIKA